MNPKDKIGSQKVQLGLFPPAGYLYGALGMQNGAEKYGPYNWREEDKKVQMMTYLNAILRHVMALIDGEDIASDSQLPHLAHIIANGGILADAIEGGFLIDNRPPKGPANKILEKYDRSEPPKIISTNPPTLIREMTGRFNDALVDKKAFIPGAIREDQY